MCRSAAIRDRSSAGVVGRELRVDDKLCGPEPVLMRRLARIFVEFSSEDAARSQLLFQRTIPDFEPSAESYALAVEVLDGGREILAAAGVTDPASFDLWTAVVAGLASQQLANDPGGDRWLRLVDDAIDMYADHVIPKRPARRRR
jgi:hypothetical protein